MNARLPIIEMRVKAHLGCLSMLEGNWRIKKFSDWTTVRIVEIKAWFILHAPYPQCHKISSLSNLHKLYAHFADSRKVKKVLTFTLEIWNRNVRIWNASMKNRSLKNSSSTRRNFSVIEIHQGQIPSDVGKVVKNFQKINETITILGKIFQVFDNFVKILQF